MTTPWGEKAAALYSREYARRYREADNVVRQGELVAHFSRWLRQICESFARDIDVLDLGCGTGRYFHALTNVRELVGVDVSAHMLEEARRPVDAAQISVQRVTTVHADFLQHDFPRGRFDLVYAIGVLAEHSPLNASVASRVFEWVAPGGVFAFTAVHPESFSVPKTWRRRVGGWLLPFTGGGLRHALRERLLAGGFYADEERLREVLSGAGFLVERIERYESDVHLHALTVARRPAR